MHCCSTYYFSLLNRIHLKRREKKRKERTTERKREKRERRIFIKSEKLKKNNDSLLQIRMTDFIWENQTIRLVLSIINWLNYKALYSVEVTIDSHLFVPAFSQTSIY